VKVYRRRDFAALIARPNRRHGNFDEHKRRRCILATGGTVSFARLIRQQTGVRASVPERAGFIERTARNVEKAVGDILTSTCFDNGTICASEQSVVVDAPVEKAVREQFKSQGGHF
jgi:acyl-CoA reductase-like NAD-dependent aldehyde dehydrogenase